MRQELPLEAGGPGRNRAGLSLETVNGSIGLRRFGLAPAEPRADHHFGPCGADMKICSRWPRLLHMFYVGNTPQYSQRTNRRFLSAVACLAACS